MRLAKWGARRVLTGIALLLLASLTLVAGGSAAGTPEASETDGLIEPLWMPLGLQDATTTVVLQLAGDPVTVAQDKANRTLSGAEKASIVNRLKAKQDGLGGGIDRLGGEVVGDYQFAYNGVKVRIARSQLGALGELPGVKAVRLLGVVEPDNRKGVQLIGAPLVWDGLAGLHGEDIKVAIIDTGIDYTHANFAGPGTTAAFNEADAADTLPPLAAHGWGLRVKGGIDLVGDDYNASADPGSPALIPHPDPNPLDCNGHGSHVAGSAAGSGVTQAGATYTGAYNASTITGNTWTIAPGVAPKADLYGIRVFGCEGSTDVTVDAIEWAVVNEMDVINMSLGSSFGSKDDPSAVASTNAASAGVIVVASAGNSGPNQYITGSPATAEGAISVAATDPSPTFPAVNVALTGGVTLKGVNANEFEYTGPIPLTVKIIADDPDTPRNESLGCSVADYGTLPANALAVVNRGVCARVAKPIFGQQAGAKAVAMINNSPGLPPVEGPITSNPDDGTPFTVTIPFVGIAGSDGPTLRSKDGTPVTLSGTTIPNPNFKGFADFSSGGPRMNDSGLKPNISAPGVSTTSTNVGTGNKALTISGTSMAAPHVAGAAALTRQAHPDWDVGDIKAAIMNTGDPSQVFLHRISRGGTGLVQPAKSTATQVVAMAKNDEFAVSVNFGYAELAGDFSQARLITLRNLGSSPATFNVAQANPGGSVHSVALGATSVTVPADGTADLQITLNVPVANVGSSSVGPGLRFHEVAGLITFTPNGGGNNGVTLRVPYYLVPRSLSNVKVDLEEISLRETTREGMVPTSATVTNPLGARSGDADFFAWGLEDPNEDGDSSADVRAVGVQAFKFSATEQLVVFAVNTHDRWSNPSTNEFDIAIDIDGDTVTDYIVVGVDLGLVQTGRFNGRMGSFVFSTRSPGASVRFFATAPTDSSTVLLPVLDGQLCRAGEPCLSTSQRFRYEATSFGLKDDSVDGVDGSAKYNAYMPVFGEGAYVPDAAPNTTTNVPLSIDLREYRASRPKGLMVVTLDNASGAAEANLVPVSLR